MEHLAARSGSIESLKSLLENGANIEATDILGQTPLHAASNSGKIESLKFLLENGANTEAMDLSGKTTLHYENIYYGYIESLKLLLEKGANIEAMDKSGKTPLDMSRSFETTQIFKNHNPKSVECTSQENENKLLVCTQLLNDASMALSKCEQQLNDKNNAIDILSSSVDLLKSDILGKASTISTLEESVNSLKMDLQSCLRECETPYAKKAKRDR